jgi:hypothetical protein
MGMRSLGLGRWRHLAILVLLGAGVGFVIGLIFRDLGFGVAAGSVLGLLYGILLTIRNPH